MISREHVRIILRLLSATWQNFKVTEATEAVWQDALLDIEPEAALEGTRYLIRTYESEWSPKPSHLRTASLRFSRGARKLAQEVFKAGPYKASTPDEQGAWERWGGLGLWKTIPDPHYCGPELMPVYLSHLKRFCEIYDHQEKELTKDQAFIGRGEAKALVQKFNVPIKQVAYGR